MRVGRLGQRLRAHVVHAQLREVGVAGDGDGALHIERAVRVVADIVFDGAVPSRGSQLPARPSPSVRQRKVRCVSSGSARSAAMAVTSLKVEPGGYWP